MTTPGPRARLLSYAQGNNKRHDKVKNLFEISSHEINEAQVTLTVFDGRTVYQN